MKLEQLIPSSIKDAMMKVTSKPKRRRMKATLINSTEEHRSAVCKELQYLTHKQNENKKIVPVLFLWGKPSRILRGKDEIHSYKSMGCNIQYLSEAEVKSLNIK
jgi:hypothetical protein